MNAVGRQLEGLREVRLEAEGTPDSADCRLIPVALAMDRVDQCISSAGVSSRVFAITR